MEKIIKYAKDHSVPIINESGLSFLLQTLKQSKSLKILEIGSAIGYSAINMALLSNKIHVTTLELDELRYSVAKQNIERLQLNDRITIFNQDALNFTTNEEFDFIFIDAAKAQYIKFFEKFEKNLKKGGIIFSDNLDFHGFVENRNEIKSRNLRQLVTKIARYIDYLKCNPRFETTFYRIGDGVSISVKL